MRKIQVCNTENFYSYERWIPVNTLYGAITVKGYDYFYILYPDNMDCIDVYEYFHNRWKKHYANYSYRWTDKKTGIESTKQAQDPVYWEVMAQAKRRSDLVEKCKGKTHDKIPESFKPNLRRAMVKPYSVNRLRNSQINEDTVSVNGTHEAFWEGEKAVVYHWD